MRECIEKSISFPCQKGVSLYVFKDLEKKNTNQLIIDKQKKVTDWNLKIHAENSNKDRVYFFVFVWGAVLQ